MSADLAVEQALRMIPDFAGKRFNVETLFGGLTNRSFRLIGDSADFVLRLNSERSRHIQFDRRREFTIQRKASEAGIAPRIVFADPDAGILVTEYLRGERWDTQRIRSPAGVEALAKLLRKVHSIADDSQTADLAGAAKAYANSIDSQEELRTFATRCVAIVEAVGAVTDPVCCHNDVVAENVIGVEFPKLIDWEFASNNDPLFDLASVVCYHDFDARNIDSLLSAYSGNVSCDLRDRLAQQMRCYDAIYWLWIACRRAVDPQPWQDTRLTEIQRRIG